MKMTATYELTRERIEKYKRAARRLYCSYAGEGSMEYLEIEVSETDLKELDAASGKSKCALLIQVMRKSDGTNCDQKIFLINKTKGKDIGYLISTLNHNPSKDDCISYCAISDN